MPISEALYSSESGEWGTPESFMAVLRCTFGEFDLDVAANALNHKAPDWFVVAENGLERKWWGNVYCNPPYGRNIGDWLAKAANEVRRHHVTRVVMLVPARTDTQWWHTYAMSASVIYLIRGRLRFEGAPASAPFPSAVILWDYRPGLVQFYPLERE